MDNEDVYKPLTEIDFSIIVNGWRNLVFFDDVYLNMQGMNIGITDPLITQYEHSLLAEYIDRKNSVNTALLVSALSQMWVYSTYEILRLWKERVYKAKKWFNCNGLDTIINTLSSDDEINPAKNIRKYQLEKFRDNKNFRDKADIQQSLLQPYYEMVELYRINLAKHTAPGKENIIPRAPGYGRINMLCGAMDYELSFKDNSFTIMNRRDIADALREMFIKIEKS